MVLPLVVGAMMVAGAVASHMQQKGQASAINDKIEDQVENEKQAFELLKQQRSLERRESFFQHHRERELYRMQNRGKIMEAEVGKQMADMQLAQQMVQSQQALFAVTQQQQVQEQQAQQERAAGYEQVTQATSPGMEAQGKLREAANQGDLVAGMTGQDGTARNMARQESTALTSAGVQASVQDTTNKGGASIQQDYELNQRIFNTQMVMQGEAISAQQRIALIQNHALNEQQTQNQELYRLERDAYIKASAANRIATRRKEGAAKVADDIQHRANITQLEAGMVQAPSTMSAVLNIGAQVAGMAAGAGAYFGNRGGAGGGLFASASMPQMSSASMPDLSGAGGVSTLTNLTRPSAISTMPPGIYPSSISTMPPRTGISGIGTMSDVIQSGRA